MTKHQLDGSLAEVGINDQYYSRDYSKHSLSLMLAAEAIHHYLLHTVASSQVAGTSSSGWFRRVELMRCGD